MLADASPLTFDDPFVLICAAVVGALAITRITRLVVDDTWPPVVWAKERFVSHVPEKWGVLVECPWCASPYIALGDLIWAWSTDLHWTWWFGNTWAAASWIAGYLTLRDIPPESRE